MAGTIRSPNPAGQPATPGLPVHSLEATLNEANAMSLRVHSGKHKHMTRPSVRPSFPSFYNMIAVMIN